MSKNKFVSKGTIKQFAKFVVTGFINTGIDMGIFWLLTTTLGITQGFYIVVFNSIGFSLATVNSFFLNKYWTFGIKKQKNREKEIVDFGQFLTVSIIGLAINSSVVFFLTTLIPPFFNIDFLQDFFTNLGASGYREYWAIFSKACATGVSLFWNFIGYKLWVFKK
ncbi:MAG: hypothetical protein GF347_03585 [Candidatus Moranbacteria bacterium]|nr:hypothetical protein [Candidatus Moranbacteria bacterium]